MINFDLNGMSARQILAYMKRHVTEKREIPNINATEKTNRRRPEVLQALREYQIWLSTRESPKEEQIPEEANVSGLEAIPMEGG